MTRRRQREHAFLMLFRTEFYERNELKDQDLLYMEELEEAAQEERDYISRKVSSTRSRLPEIDKMIDEKASGWSLNRIGKVELTILRLALYEMLYDDTIPDSVAINEAVEIAKKFGGDDSSSFINGVLSKFAK